MFKAMLAAAGGADKGRPAAKAPSQPVPAPVAKNQVKSVVPAKPVQQNLVSNPTKPKTFTAAKGHDFTAHITDHKPQTKPVGVSKPAMKPASTKPQRAVSKPTTKSVRAKPASGPSSRPTLNPPRPEYKPPPAQKAKKLNFLEIMNKAKDVSGEKLTMDVKTLSREEREKQRQKSLKPSPAPAPAPAPVSVRKDHKSGSLPRIKRSPAPATPKSNVVEPAPAAKPSSELLEKLKRKRQNVNDDDSDLDGFVIDDEQEDSGYRSQIWEALGRRPTRARYDDDSSDDMEATGADLFLEEEQSARVARREDLLEERRLRELAEAKAARKKKKLH